MVACLNGHTQTIQLLLSFGRKIDVFNKSIKYDYSDIKSDSTALDVAKQRNETDIVQIL